MAEESESDLLVCALCANKVKRIRWSMHWKRSHGITSFHARKELKDGEDPTNPYWLAGELDGQSMIEADVDEHSLGALLPIIRQHIQGGGKIPWEYRDFTFKLIKAGHILWNDLKWGLPMRRNAMVTERERDFKSKRTFHPPGSNHKKGLGK